MFEVFRKELEWAGRKLVLETGKIARQADGAVLATYGETTVLCTAVGAKSPGLFKASLVLVPTAILAAMIAMITETRPLRNSETTAMASRMPGIAINPSIIRISTPSMPRYQPAIRPSGNPITIAPMAKCHSNRHQM